MKRHTKFITATFLITVILAMLFLLFIYPFLSDDYIEHNTQETIIIFSILLLSIEGLVCVLLKGKKKNFMEKIYSK